MTFSAGAIHRVWIWTQEPDFKNVKPLIVNKIKMRGNVLR